VGHLYYDPEDLSKNFLDFVGQSHPPCLGCKEVEWLREEIPDQERKQVEKGPWGWTLNKMI
jgi:hypothetical protein